MPDYRGWGLCIAVTLVISYLIWKFIETPMRGVAKRWAQRDRGQREPGGLRAPLPMVAEAQQGN